MPHTLLSGPQLESALASVPAWRVDDGKLHRRFQFADFRHAFAFMAHAALAAEAMNHHPEWRNVYRTVDVWLVTHDAGGITTADVELARAMDAIVQPTGLPPCS